MTREKRFRKHVIAAAAAYKNLLDSHCANGYTVDEVSASYRISRNTLQFSFRELYGMGIRDYKLKVRMEFSRELLVAGKDVKEVALTLQYTKARAFSHAFKKYYGMNPTVFVHLLAY